MHIEEVRVDLDGYEGQKMRQITGRNTVPQIFIDGEHIGGFDDLKKLDDRGGLKRRLRGGE
jgi:glutaredoxin 3